MASYHTESVEPLYYYGRHYQDTIQIGLYDVTIQHIRRQVSSRPVSYTSIVHIEITHQVSQVPQSKEFDLCRPYDYINWFIDINDSVMDVYVQAPSLTELGWNKRPDGRPIIESIDASYGQIMQYALYDPPATLTSVPKIMHTYVFSSVAPVIFTGYTYDRIGDPGSLSSGLNEAGITTVAVSRIKDSEINIMHNAYRINLDGTTEDLPTEFLTATTSTAVGADGKKAYYYSQSELAYKDTYRPIANPILMRNTRQLSVSCNGNVPIDTYHGFDSSTNFFDYLVWTLAYGESGQKVLAARFEINQFDAGGIGDDSFWDNPADWETGWQEGDPTHTLNVTVNCALSGRHNDPLNNTSLSYTPADQKPQQRYGSGGDGGHGGGGGAGASTAIVYDFTTNKAMGKNIVVKPKRHGYGSGGGKGGKGGDGIILIYY